jgi:hypothetical protein
VVGCKHDTWLDAQTLPTLMILFAIGLSIVAGVDLSSSLVYGVLATRRALSAPLAERTRTAAVAVIIKSWLPLVWLCTACAASVFLLLAHMHVLSEIAPSLRTSLLQAAPAMAPALERHALKQKYSSDPHRLQSVDVGRRQESEDPATHNVDSLMYIDKNDSVRVRKSAARRLLGRGAGAGAGWGVGAISKQIVGREGAAAGGTSLVMLAESAGGGLPAWAFDVSEPFAIANGYGLFRRCVRSPPKSGHQRSTPSSGC